jgi:hypothetical protein
LPQIVIDRALERDEAAARAEYLAEFRTDVEALLPLENIEACVSTGVKERAVDLKHNYIAFCDPSGGSSDSMTMAIGHLEGKTVNIDAIRERKPPFSPEAVVEEFCSLLASYKIHKVWGDRYAGSWVGEQFSKRGAFYEVCEKSKSQLYQDMLPALNSRTLDLLDDQRLINQLAGLERRTSRGGRDVIDHAPGSHDDVANAVAGATVMAVTDTGISAAQRRRDTEKIHAHYEKYGRRFMRA